VTVKATRPLRELATLHSVLTGYIDAAGQRQGATDEALLGVLHAMGLDVQSTRQISDALRRRRDEISRRSIEPVTVAWDGHARIDLNLQKTPAARVSWELVNEAGQLASGQGALQERQHGDAIARTEILPRPTHRLRLGRTLAPGYYDLRIRAGRREYQTRIFAAPKTSYAPSSSRDSWGVFLPIYSLSSKRNWGAGDFTDFEELARFIESRGGSVVATLPLLATFLDQPYEPSPYSPASRLFWNEFYIDVTRVPELKISDAARQTIDSAEFQSEIEVLRRMSLVDYRRLMARKREVLELLADTFFSTGSSDRRSAFEQFLADRANLHDYARFRAVTERQRRGWPVWPEPLRSGTVRQSDYDPRAVQYHLYAQWVTSEQLSSLAERARSAGRGLYLDFPLGVHPDGFDVWRERDSFAREVSVGAPPDPFFTLGQNWGFPPLHPDRLRNSQYRYLIEVLRHHMQFAGTLRLDHVMALHRLYWIPSGMEATAGVYVRYPAEELYAILSIESHRHRTMVVGEDLGTVPAYVRKSMSRHNLRRMYVLQYEARSDPRAALNEMIPGAVASLNTHDMPPFSAFWEAADVDSRVEMGLLNQQEAATSREARARTRSALVSFLKKRGFLKGNPEVAMAVHDACMAYLSRSDADVVLENLEDLWLEDRPQNTPGTSGDQKPNWRRKARKSLEEIRSSPSVTLRLKTIDLLRKQGR
jgi:4-alpha-glucanotransferase